MSRAPVARLIRRQNRTASSSGGVVVHSWPGAVADLDLAYLIAGACGNALARAETRVPAHWPG